MSPHENKQLVRRFYEEIDKAIWLRWMKWWPKIVSIITHLPFRALNHFAGVSPPPIFLLPTASFTGELGSLGALAHRERSAWQSLRRQFALPPSV